MIDEAIDNFVINLDDSDTDSNNDEEDREESATATTSSMMKGFSVLPPSP